MIRVAIVDDEPLARERAADVLRSRGDVEVVAALEHGLAAVAYLQDARRAAATDVLLLDIQMPGLTGFEVLAALRDQPGGWAPPPLVFLTAYDRFALDAFEAGAVDYVLKPFTDARLLAAVERALRFGAGGQTADGQTADGHAAGGRAAPDRDVARTAALDATLAAAAPALPPRLVARRYGELCVIPFDEIRWVAAQGNYLEVHARDGGVHLVAGTVDDLARRLPPAFARVHRSAIVRLDLVRRVTSEGHGDATLTLDRGERVRASRRFRGAVERLLDPASGPPR